jgi:hypothetical protein
MLGLVLLLALLVVPEDTPKPGAAPPSMAAKSASAKSAPAGAAVASKTIVGEIVWVDFPSRLVLVRESVKSTAVKGKPATRETIALAVAPDVPVIRGKQPSTFAELKPKDHVVARYLPTADGAKAVSLRVADATTGAPRAASGTTPAPAGTPGNAN